MIDRNMKKGDLKALTGLSYSTISKLESGSNVNMSVIDNICTQLDCNVDDILEIVPNDKVSVNG